MRISGWIVGVGAVWLSFGMRKRFVALMNKLADSGVLNRGASPDEFERRATRTIGRQSLFVMVVLVVVSVTLLVVYASPSIDPLWLRIFLCVWAGSVIGERLGRLIAYSRAVSLVTGSGGGLEINFWHPDNAGGLLPLSDFFFFSAPLVSAPLVWLAFWWAIAMHAQIWSSQTIWLSCLWLVSALLWLYTLLYPVWTIHRQMLRTKHAMMSDLGWISVDLAKLHRDITAAKDDQAAATAIYERISNLQKIYSSANAVTTWPVDTHILTRFAGIGALQAALPFAVRYVFGTSDFLNALSAKLI